MKKVLYKNKKIIIFLTIIFIFALIIIYFWINKNLKSSKRLSSVLQSKTAAGTLSLSFVSSSVNVGDTADLNILLNTGGEDVLGADIFLEYDPNKWSVIEINPNKDTGFKTFVPFVSESDSTFDWQKAVKEESLIKFGTVIYDLNPDWDGDLSSITFNGVASPLATVKLKTKPVRRDTSEQISIRAQTGITTDSNILNKDGNDILGTVDQATVKIKAEDVCRAAVDLSDQKPGLNDLLYILAKGWGNACPDCHEDLDGSKDIGLGDLLYVVNYWGQECPVLK